MNSRRKGDHAVPSPLSIPVPVAVQNAPPPHTLTLLTFLLYPAVAVGFSPRCDRWVLTPP